MSASYKHPRSQPKTRRVSLRTTGRSANLPSRGGTANPLRLEHTWAGPNRSLSSTPSSNPFYIAPSDTAPSTPVAADIEAYKLSFPKLPVLDSGGRADQHRIQNTPTPLTRQHAVIISGKPLGAERRTGGQLELPSTDAEREVPSIHSSPISIKIESSPTKFELVLKGIWPTVSSSGDGTLNANSPNQPGPSKRPLDSSNDRQNRKARRISKADSSVRNPIDELVLQWAKEALEEEEAVTEEDRHHLPKFTRGPPPPMQSRYNLRDRAKVVKRETIFVERTEQDYINLHPAFFRKAAVKTFNPANLPIPTIDLFHGLCSRTPRGLTLVEFSKVFLQCQTEYRSIEYDIGLEFLGYRRRGLSEEQITDMFVTCSLCERVFLRKYNRSHICDSDK
ncbi:hypothetical protein CC2G_014665 [Coprinopsis cinerea AmutBmut pab1-1]|nr:hypothetical protein CC2G_014665 [Coprinopsis cinerea AmutBmut pab1-1]